MAARGRGRRRKEDERRQRAMRTTGDACSEMSWLLESASPESRVVPVAACRRLVRWGTVVGCRARHGIGQRVHGWRLPRLLHDRSLACSCRAKSRVSASTSVQRQPLARCTADRREERGERTRAQCAQCSADATATAQHSNTAAAWRAHWLDDRSAERTAGSRVACVVHACCRDVTPEPAASLLCCCGRKAARCSCLQSAQPRGPVLCPLSLLPLSPAA